MNKSDDLQIDDAGVEALVKLFEMASDDAGKISVAEAAMSEFLAAEAAIARASSAEAIAIRMIGDSRG